MNTFFSFINAHLLSLLTALPFLGALIVTLIPQCKATGGAENPESASPASATPAPGSASDAPQSRLAHRLVALGFMGLVLAVTLGLFWAFYTAPSNSPLVQALFAWQEQFDWIPSLGINYHLGVDCTSILFLLLSALVTPFALLVWGSRANKAAIVLILLLQTTLIGVFTAQNFIHWFLYYELSLIPAFLLIRQSGTPRATAAATKFFIYTLAGGFAMLLAMLAVYQAKGTFDHFSTFLFLPIGPAPSLRDALVSMFGGATWVPVLVVVGLFLGVAVKIPIVPFHTWLPDTYTEAPTPVSMLLTGLMSKMGIYALLRLVVPAFIWLIPPDAYRQAVAIFFGFAVVTVLFPALVALRQTDVKRLLAYSSINHLGYCLVAVSALLLWMGLPASRHCETADASAIAAAAVGWLLQVFNHGLTAAALFGFVFLLETRSGGLRGLGDFGGLRKAAPIYCTLFAIAVFSSMGLPGLNGFWGEFLIFLGSFQSLFASLKEPSLLSPFLLLPLLAVPGIFLTAVFLMNLQQKLFHGPLPERWRGFPEMTVRERLVFGPAIALMFVLGVWPQLLISLFSR